MEIPLLQVCSYLAGVSLQKNYDFSSSMVFLMEPHSYKCVAKTLVRFME